MFESPVIPSLPSRMRLPPGTMLRQLLSVGIAAERKGLSRPKVMICDRDALAPICIPDDKFNDKTRL